LLTKENNYKSFIIPSLTVVRDLSQDTGGAWLSDIESEFIKRYKNQLDPSVKDWFEIKKNHGKTRWQDGCGSRVAYHHLIPNKYISFDSHGSKGSFWKITKEGRDLLEKN
jgi:hypothetical protein